MRVLLIVAPFGLIEYPNLAASLLKAEARAAGHECDLVYASVEFAKRIGFTQYRVIYTVDSQLLIPERIFAGALFGDRIPGWGEYVRDVVAPYDSGLSGVFRRPDGKPSSSATHHRFESEAREFVEEFVSRPDLAGYDVIGFSNSYGQNVAALALARGLKERHPGSKIIFGGANCAGQMGRTLLELFPWIDYVCDGEGDLAFPAFLRELEAGEDVAVPGIYGRAGSDGAPGAAGLEAELVRDLDALPFPEYSDYFAAFDFDDEAGARTVAIPMETSRGCWWGAKHHCIFCGLNRNEMLYRRKSPERIDAELRSLVRDYGVRDVMMTDNIMIRSFPKEVLPLLEHEREHECIFFEVKANLRKEELRRLAEGGILHLQPGIESLSTRVLGIMDKGVDSFQNLQLLKWGKEFGIAISWNILCGFPGERPEDYEAMAELVPKIVHLKPALGLSVITIDRFSPLFGDPERFGIEIQPVRGYGYVYPFDDEKLRELAYWFSHSGGAVDSSITLAPPAYARRLSQAYQIWKRLHHRVDFCYRYISPGTIEVHDTRPVAESRERKLDPLETRVFEALDRKGSLAQVLRRIDEPGRETEVAAVVERFRGWSYLHEEEGEMLVLANRDPEDAGVSAGRARAEGLGGMAAAASGR